MNKQNPILVFTNTQILNYYNYNVICNYCFEEPEPVIQNTYTYEENGVYYCASATQKGVYWYVYARNCPLMYTDPDGEFIQYIIGAVVGFINGLSQGASIANTKGATGWEKFGIMMAGAHIGADIGAATAGIGTAISNSLTAVGITGGIASEMIVQGTTGAVSGCATGLAMGGLAGLKGNELWKQVGIGFGMGLGTGIAMGALTGGIEAAVKGENIWKGGPTLKTKLNMLVEQNRAAMLADIGEGDAKFLVGTRSNVNEYGDGHTYEWGRIFNKDGREANGFYSSGDVIGTNDAGYYRYGNNKAIISKTAIREMWNGLEGPETLYHEWWHCNKLFTGEANQIFNTYANPYNNHYFEWQAHQFVYNQFGTANSAYWAEYYRKLFFGIK